MNAKDDEIDLSKEIKADREEIGWTQVEVAKHLRDYGIEIFQQGVGKWERGSMPRGKKVNALIKLFGENSRTAIRMKAEREYHLSIKAKKE